MTEGLRAFTGDMTVHVPDFADSYVDKTRDIESQLSSVIKPLSQVFLTVFGVSEIYGIVMLST